MMLRCPPSQIVLVYWPIPEATYLSHRNLNTSAPKIERHPVLLIKLTRQGQICLATHCKKQPDALTVCTFSPNIVIIALTSQIKDAERTPYREV